jgi:hypothetical protein
MKVHAENLIALAVFVESAKGAKDGDWRSDHASNTPSALIEIAELVQLRLFCLACFRWGMSIGIFPEIEKILDAPSFPAALRRRLNMYL